MSAKRKDRKKVPTEKRRWRSPPPLLRDADSPAPEGMAVLEERRSEAGMVLWKSLRSVLLWADTEPDERKDLFPEDARARRHGEIHTVLGEDHELNSPLGVLADLLSKPDKAKAAPTANACYRIHEWASGSDAPRTAMEFLQAAALCHPARGEYALEVGRLARELGQPARAEAWFQRAVGMSRQSKDWTTYIQAYLDHGRMMVEKGALPAARRSYIKALRRSIRQGMRKWEARTLQDLFVLEDRAGNVEEALSYAHRAFHRLRKRPDELPRLAHDLAVFWIDRGHSDLAYPLLDEAVSRLDESAQGTALGLLARAAGAAGDADAFEAAVEELDRWWSGPGVARAWADVTRGAVSLGRADQARDAARRAETMARRRGEDPGSFQAEDLLARAREGEPDPDPFLSVEDTSEEELATSVLDGLSRGHVG